MHIVGKKGVPFSHCIKTILLVTQVTQTTCFTCRCLKNDEQLCILYFTILDRLSCKI